MNKEIYTFFVDPENRIIQHKKMNAESWYEDMRSDIGCRLLETNVVLDRPITRFWGDEEAKLINEEKRFFFNFSTIENLSTGNRVFNHTRMTPKYREAWSDPIVWEFCGKCFFTGVAYTEEGEEPDTIQLHLWEFAQCIEFQHPDYQPKEPMVEFRILD